MEIELTKAQMELMSRDDESLLIFCAGVSSGKTYCASWYVAKALCEGKRIIVSAQNYLALSRVILAEVMKRLTEIGVEYSYNKIEKEIHVGSRGCVYGATGEAPSGILGLSDIDILVLDEASYQQEDAYNFGSDRLRGREVAMPRIRLFTSPDSFNASHAWFINLCIANPKAVINCSALDNPYTSESFKADLLRRYPPGSVLYEQQILGRIVDSRSANAAIDDRLFVESRPKHLETDPVWVGADIAGAGRDDSFFAVIDQYGIVDTRRIHGAETQRLVSEMLEINRKYKVAGGAIDVTGGFGNGLYDFTKNSVKGLFGVNFAESADDDKTYNNIRSEMYLELGTSVKSSEFYLPTIDDGRLIREECRYALYIIDNRGKTAMIPKEDIRKSIGRSPDGLDALCLAVKAKKRSGDSSIAAKASKVAFRVLAAHYRH